LGKRPPARMTDGRDASYQDWSRGYDPAVWLDRSIAATMRAVFPFNGLHVDE
jgi:acetoin utilization protein AcuC